jgi:polysaccharide deacetylase 2 family uncharacterized protein YibQ
VLLLWTLLVALLLPDLRDRLLGRPLPPAPVRHNALHEAIQKLDHAIAATLDKTAPGLKVLHERNQTSTLDKLHWRQTELELEMPRGVTPEAVQKALTRLALEQPLEWKVVVDAFTLEPLSLTLQVSVSGLPTHQLTLYAAPPPADIHPQGIPVAILIDDGGLSRDALRPLWELEEPFSLAILPYSPFALQLAESAQRNKREVLVDLPMEALTGDPSKAPPGQLTRAQDLDTIAELTRKAIVSVPFASGVLTHQGGAFTRDRERMHRVLEILKDQRLFFVDSKTSADSVGLEVARELEVSAAQRAVFIDRDPTPEAILRALERLRVVAMKQGGAIGIANPQPATIQVLLRWIPQAKEAGIELVPVSELVH